MSETQTELNRYLNFSLGKEDYAVPLLSVREVVAMPTLTPLPHTPPYFLGLMNLRGQVMTVIDLKKKLGIAAGSSNETTVIICDFDGSPAGYVVDSVNCVLSASEADLAPAPVTQGPPCVSGVFKTEKNLVLLLDLQKLLDSKDRTVAANAGARAA